MKDVNIKVFIKVNKNRKVKINEKLWLKQKNPQYIVWVKKNQKKVKKYRKKFKKTVDKNLKI